MPQFCFTCAKDSVVATRISRGLATTFTSNIDDSPPATNHHRRPERPHRTLTGRCGRAEVQVAGRPFRIGDELLHDIKHQAGEHPGCP
jgi:hypothetical protein